MGIFRRKKRTTKEIGKQIGESLQRQKVKEKNLRTLIKETETREKEEDLNRRIAELKAKRPTLFKKILAKTESGASKIRAFRERSKEFRRNIRLSSTPKRAVKRRAVRRTPIRRRAVRRTPIRRRAVRRTPIRRRAVRRRVERQVTQPQSLLTSQSFFN